jgi:hypothetical protein
MKINHRIILVNLLVVAIVLGSAAIAFYTIMSNTLTSQLSQNILNSSRNFIFTYRSFVDDLDEEFLTYNNRNPELLFERPTLLGNLNDFFLEAEDSDSTKIIRFAYKSFIQIPSHNFTINEFVQLNPYAIISVKKTSNNRICYYGKIINSNTLDDFANQIGSDVSLIWDGITAEVSNPNLNNQHTFALSKAYKHLNQKNNKELFVGILTSIILLPYKLKNFLTMVMVYIIFKSNNGN